jgi:LmbE family N-acetylglucosaminyl deacetylase
MTAVLQALLRRVEASGRPVLAVSPHLDDAVLSAGAWLSALSEVSPVLVATVFSAAAGPPYSWIARRFVRGSGYGEATELFAARRAEDLHVLSELGLTPVHLGQIDAVFRRTAIGPWTRPSYPTLRFDALRGRLARSDRSLRVSVARLIAELIDRHDPALVLAPLGIGRHVDHLIVRDGVRTADRARRRPAGPASTTEARRTGESQETGGPAPRWDVVYASDQPYALTQSPEAAAVEGLDRHEWTRGRERALRVAAGYRTQMPVLYPNGAPITPEMLWVPCAVVKRGR